MQTVYISPLLRDESLMKLLPQKEQERISYFPTEKKRIESLSNSILLSKILKQLNYEKYDIGFDKHGKPFLVGINLFHNISHNESFVVCAISPKNPVGIDVEKISSRHIRVAKKVCTEKELNKLESLPIPDQAYEFTRIWTLKEAFSKMLGVGLLLSFSEILITEFDNYYCIRHGQDMAYASVLKFGDSVIAICTQNERINMKMETMNISRV